MENCKSFKYRKKIIKTFDFPHGFMICYFFVSVTKRTHGSNVWFFTFWFTGLTFQPKVCPCRCFHHAASSKLHGFLRWPPCQRYPFFSASRGNGVTIHGKNPWRPKITCINKTIDITPLLIKPDQIDIFLKMQLRNESGYKFGQLENLTQNHPVTSDCEKTFAPYSHGRFRRTPFLSKEVHPHSSTSQCSVQ